MDTSTESMRGLKVKLLSFGVQSATGAAIQSKHYDLYRMVMLLSLALSQHLLMRELRRMLLELKMH